MVEFHIRQDAPCLPHWPNGAWSVFKITGDQIAERTVREKVIKDGHYGPCYSGKVIARHSWCGYVGMFETFQAAVEAMQAIINEAARRKALDDANVHTPFYSQVIGLNRS